MMYIFGFETNPNIRQIIAAVLYVSCEDGTYVNWFAVSNKMYDKRKFSGKASDQPFTGMGIGGFLLTMVQLQAVARGFSISLYLQALKSSEAFTWYQHRGFFAPPENNPTLLPIKIQIQLENNSTGSLGYINFSRTEEMIEDYVTNRGYVAGSPDLENDLLHLLWLKEPIKRRRYAQDLIDSQVTEVESQKEYDFYCKPSGVNACFLKFPFTEVGVRLNEATADLVFFSLLKFKHESDELREVSNNELYRRLQSKIKRFDTVMIDGKTYMDLKKDVVKQTYKQWLNGDTIEFFSKWLMRDKSSECVAACEIISPLVTKEVDNFFYFGGTDESKRFSMSFIHDYLYFHLDILSKKFVFFLHNVEKLHWWGWAAINPWVCLAQASTMRDDETEDDGGTEFAQCDNYVYGLLACDGMKQTKTQIDAFSVIWFLNVASVYRDLQTDKCFEEFNIAKHTPESYWLLGCRGPFGVINAEKPELIRYPLLSMPVLVQIKQRDGYNCGVIWCLFLLEMVVNQAGRPYNFKDELIENVLPNQRYFGRTWMKPNIFSMIEELKNDDTKMPENLIELHSKEQPVHLSKLMKIFREELVICLEKLRVCRLENDTSPARIHKPVNWGVPSETYKNLVTASERKLSQQLVTDSNQAITRVKEERELAEKLHNDIMPLLPGSLYLAPTQDMFADDTSLPIFTLTILC